MYIATKFILINNTYICYDLIYVCRKEPAMKLKVCKSSRLIIVCDWLMGRLSVRFARHKSSILRSFCSVHIVTYIPITGQRPQAATQ
jgi:hypothetical protein